MTVELDWMRHGKTISNVIRDTEGITGFFKQAFIGETLHEEGIRQTSQMAVNPELQNRLNNYDYIFCSMLPRSIQTALILFPNRKIHLAPFLNEYRPWWAMGLDWVNRPSNNLEDLKQKISDFPNVQNLAFDFVEEHSKNGDMWSKINQSSPDDFYQFVWQKVVLPEFTKNLEHKILIISHSWYMYYNFGLPLYTLSPKAAPCLRMEEAPCLRMEEDKKQIFKHSVNNNELWCELGDFDDKNNGLFQRKSIHFIFDPSAPQERTAQEYFSMNPTHYPRRIIMYENV